MAAIVVVDLTNVTVDGVPSGSVTDVLTNFKAVAGIRGDLQRALQDWAAAEKQAAVARIATLQGQVDALGGTALGKQMAKAARRQSILDRKQAAERELLDIDAET